MSPPPDVFAARVIEARMKVPDAHLGERGSHDLLTLVMAEMRIGTFKKDFVDIFRRFNTGHFYCYICGSHLREGKNEKGAITAYPDVRAHRTLHINQVQAVLEPWIQHTDWSHTDEPEEQL